MEEIQAAAAKKLRKVRLAAVAGKSRIAQEEAERATKEAQRVLSLSPVDLTEDNDPGGSNSNSESSLFDSEQSNRRFVVCTPMFSSGPIKLWNQQLKGFQKSVGFPMLSPKSAG